MATAQHATATTKHPMTQQNQKDRIKNSISKSLKNIENVLKTFENRISTQT